jgi:hypothetical protein
MTRLFSPLLLVVLVGCTTASDDEIASSSPEGGEPTSAADATRGASTTSTSTSTSSTSSTSTPTAGVDSTGAETEPACPQFASASAAGTLEDPRLSETSGLAVSRRQPDVLWSHNDSGDTARVFALGPDRAVRAEYVLTGVTSTDWEDIAIGPGPQSDSDYLYVGDIGDNLGSRRTVDVLRFLEPTVEDSADSIAVDGVDVLTLRYPDGPHDAETLMSDPFTGDLIIVTKEDPGPSTVFRFAAPLSTSGTIEGEEIATLGFGSTSLPGSPMTTAGDISSDGTLIAIRTYTHAFAWRRWGTTTVAEALQSAPCPLPLRLEIQGESLAFGTDGAAYFTVAEGSGRQVWRYDAL